MGYDNVKSVTYKAEYILKKGLAGAMVWSIDYEDQLNNCGDGVFPLMTAINNALHVSINYFELIRQAYYYLTLIFNLSIV